MGVLVKYIIFNVILYYNILYHIISFPYLPAHSSLVVCYVWKVFVLLINIMF